MVKALTAATLTKMAQELGTEPLLIVQINWSSGTEYYADKEIAVGAIAATGVILSASEISSSGKQDSTGEISSINIVLDDTDGTLKTKINQIIIEGTSGTVYQHFVGNAEADLTPLLTGKIAGDILWSEGERTLTFDLETAIEDGEAGCAPSEGAFPNLQPEAVDKPWPLAFGTVLNVPAVRVKFRPKGTLANGINQNFSAFTVTGGADFPQSPTVIQIRIAGILYTGTMTGEVFTFTSKNDAHNINVQITNRLTSDPDKNESAILWIEDSNVNLSLQYCFVTHPTAGIMINFCERQEGQKCFFQKSWQSDDGLQQSPQGGTEYLLDNTNVILETSSVPRGSWGAPFIWLYITHIPAGLFNDAISLTQAARIIQGDRWSIPSDVDVLLEVSFNDTYVANCIPGVELLRVSAFRKFNQKSLLMAVPSSYYTVNLSDTLGTENPFTIEFPIALRDRPDEEWEDEIFVSYRSSQGANVADIIKFLIETFSTMSIDVASFNAVRPKVANFPANFAIFDQPNVLSLIESIAFQARCVLFIKNGVVTIIYLSEIPTAVDTLTENNTQLKTVDLSFTTTEDIITKIEATWLSDYSGRIENSNTFVYRNNIALFGLRPKEINFFIYNIESLVQLSAAFWGFRFSNSWRVIESGTFLKNLEFETLDAVDYAIPILSSNTLLGVLEEVGHDTGTDLISLRSTLASKAGGGGEPTQDDDYFEGDPSFQIPGAALPPDPGAGIGEGGDLPTAGNDDEDDDPEDAGTGDPGGQDPLQLTFIIHPIQTERGVSYDILIQALNSAGQIVAPVTVPTITLSLSAGDPADVLNTSPVSLIGGQHTFTGVQITGGSGTDATTIQVTSSLSDWTTGSFNFTVIALQLTTLSWDTVPAAVTRNATFTVAISGGAALDVLDVQLAGSDTNDKLFDASGEVTQITLDGSGDFTASDWFINGGTDSDTGNFILHDPDLIFADTPSSSFTITGISKQFVSQTIGITQVIVSDNRFIEIAQGGVLRDGDPFTLTLTMKRNNGDTDTTFNGTFDLSAVDAVGTVMTWGDVGPEATSYVSFILAGATAGVWTYNAVTMNLAGAISPITFNVVEFQGTVSGTLTVPLSADATLEVRLLDLRPTRNNDFKMVFIATLDGQNFDTTFSEDITLTINSSDGLDTLAVVNIPGASFTGGVASITNQQINGGAGKDTVGITATTASLVGSVNAYVGFNRTGLAQVINSQLSYAAEVLYNGSPILEADDLSNFFATQNTSQTDFNADTTLAIEPSVGMQVSRRLFDNFNYFDLQTLTLAGYTEYVINVTDQGNSAAMVLGLGMKTQAFFESVIRHLDPDLVPAFVLKMKYDFRDVGDPLLFTSGQALKDMIPDQTMPFSFLLEQSRLVGFSPGSSVNFEFEIDLQPFKDTTKTNVRVWFYLEGPTFTYIEPFTGVLFNEIRMQIQSQSSAFLV